MAANGFPMPPLDRYRVAWRALAGARRAVILEARREGELLASGMVVIEGDRSYYLFSGSRREEREARGVREDGVAQPFAKATERLRGERKR